MSRATSWQVWMVRLTSPRMAVRKRARDVKAQRERLAACSHRDVFEVAAGFREIGQMAFDLLGGNQ